jgi:hypothetical protein
MNGRSGRGREDDEPALNQNLNLSLLTKYGLFSLRYYEEFDAHATLSGRSLFFSVSL